MSTTEAKARGNTTTRPEHVILAWLCMLNHSLAH